MVHMYLCVWIRATRHVEIWKICRNFNLKLSQLIHYQLSVLTFNSSAGNPDLKSVIVKLLYIHCHHQILKMFTKFTILGLWRQVWKTPEICWMLGAVLTLISPRKFVQVIISLRLFVPICALFLTNFLGFEAYINCYHCFWYVFIFRAVLWYFFNLTDCNSRLK